MFLYLEAIVTLIIPEHSDLILVGEDDSGWTITI